MLLHSGNRFSITKRKGLTLIIGNIASFKTAREYIVDVEILKRLARFENAHSANDGATVFDTEDLDLRPGDKVFKLSAQVSDNLASLIYDFKPRIALGFDQMSDTL
jgi:hypothetical protein